MKLDEEAYDPAQLEWFDLYRGLLRAGQLLASFELLEASQTVQQRGQNSNLGATTGLGIGDGNLLRDPLQAAPKVSLGGIHRAARKSVESVRPNRVPVPCTTLWVPFPKSSFFWFFWTFSLHR